MALFSACFMLLTVTNSVATCSLVV